MKIRGALITVLCILVASCSDINGDTLTGEALFFRSGMLKVYPELDRISGVTVQSIQSRWPRQVTDKFSEERWNRCVIMIYRIEATGHYKYSNWFEADSIVILDEVSGAQRQEIIETLGIEALNDDAVCASAE